ncbi:hypothetical protein [Kineosporia sp. NBRC 101731]|uniref:hypothetical protein n=1 Tax=Kineosporia sp. NBRC 101731 TaxID=3032199 RepID=UPI0024A0A5CA|nr:hypothetical protein [Kineosporia sp. NBRC 101731]GLY28798.1 hypothetical protein Kisp02_21630 [Kineosporia sp. NBRC 101731]
MTSTTADVRNGRAPLLGLAALACAALAPATIVFSLKVLPGVVVLGGLILPLWTVSVVFVLLAAVVLGAALVTGARASRARNDTGSVGSAVSVLLVMATAIVMVATLLFVVIALFMGHLLSNNIGSKQFARLRPEGPCRVVAQYSTYLTSGTGTFFAVNDLGLGLESGHYDSDDGTLPFDDGNYTLTWNDDIATITYGGEENAAPHRETVHC